MSSDKRFILAAALSFLIKWTPNIFLLYAIYFNLGLAMFNLIPIPPLDGSRILAGLLPRPWMRPYLAVERFGFLIILALYFSGFLSGLILPGMKFFSFLLGIPELRDNF